MAQTIAKNTQEKNTPLSASGFFILSISFSVALGSVNKNPKAIDTKEAQIKGRVCDASLYRIAKITGVSNTMPIYLKFEPIIFETILYLII